MGSDRLTEIALRPADLAPTSDGAFEAFSRIHLTTRAEQAAYRRFASDPEACWSDADIAFVSRLDISAVRSALENLSHAGILEEVEEGCFRWRRAMRYALDRREPDTGRPRDPVCGMPVPRGVTYRAHDMFGRTERFCYERCLTAFLVWPIAFTRAPEGKTEVVVKDRGQPGAP